MSETKKHTGGRAKHVPTEVTRALVEGFLSFGIPQGTVANYIGIGCTKTLQKYYGDLIDSTKPHKLQKLLSKAFDKALNDVDNYGNTGNTSMLIFLLKTVGQLRTTDDAVLEIPVEAVDKINVTVFPEKKESE